MHINYVQLTTPGCRWSCPNFSTAYRFFQAHDACMVHQWNLIKEAARIGLFNILLKFFEFFRRSYVGNILEKIQK